MYSRITGYYRPVQNWNDGKTQEFKDRKVYDLSHSVLKTSHAVKAEDGVCEETAAPSVATPLLFTRSGCPNCKTSKLMLDKAGVHYTVVNAEEDAALTRKYGVKKAPSLLVTDGNGFKTYDNASEIRKYIESIG